MRDQTLRTHLLCFLLFFVCLTGFAQAPEVSIAKILGHPAYTPEDGDKIESVNLSTGALHIEIPIYTVSFRGKDYTWKYVYDSPVFAAQFNPQPDPSDPDNIPFGGLNSWWSIRSTIPDDDASGWRLVSPFAWGLLSEASDADAVGQPLTCSDVSIYPNPNGTSYGPLPPVGSPGYYGQPGGLSYTQFQGFSVISPDGTKHAFDTTYGVIALAGTTPLASIPNCSAPSALKSYATDGSGALYDVFSNKAVLKDGTVVTLGSNPDTLDPAYQGLHYRDTNGNLGAQAGIVDFGTVAAGGNGTTQYDIRDAMGNIQHFAVTVGYAPLHTNDCDVISRTPPRTCVEADDSSIATISNITLPNGQVYSFEYNQNGHGELTKMTLPTGATVNYSYGYLYIDQQVMRGATHYYHTTVKTRTVTTDGVPAVWTYNILSDGIPQGPISSDPTVKDPNGNCTQYGFLNLAGPGVVSDVISYDGCDTTKILKTVHTDYAWDQFGQNAGAETRYRNLHPIRVTTTLENGLSSKVETDYEKMITDVVDPPATEVATVTNLGAVYSPIEVREYDFGATTPTRTTRYSYLHDTGGVSGTGTTYKALNIIDRVTSKEIHQGSASGPLIAKTQYEYDNYSGGMTARPGAVLHDSSFGTGYTTRGNVTAISAWDNINNIWLMTHYAYDELGNVVSVTDPLSHTTAYDFTDQFSDSNCVPSGNHLYSVATTITNAAGQQTKGHYSSCTGILRQMQDPNDLAQGRQGTQYAFDSVNNLTDVSYPDGGGVHYNFGGYALPLTITKRVDTGTGPQITSSIQLDGRGRAHIATNPDGNISETYYDGVSRITSVTNPHGSSSSSTDGTTSFEYDALDRKIYQHNPDGSNLHWTYAGNTVDSYDETSHHWQRTSDAFGQLTDVYEPDPSNNNPALHTHYTYDPLSNLTNVDQYGSSTTPQRSRSFSYDTLARLTSSTNPETGTIIYHYLNGSTLCAGDVSLPCSKTDARGVTTTYAYDALNRLTYKSYSNGDITQSFGYDGNDNGGNPLSGFGLTSSNAVGRLSFFGNSNSIDRVYSYDAMGRLTAQTDNLPDQCCWNLHTSALYDLAGNMRDLTYPDGRSVTQSFDSAGRLASVKNGTFQNPGSPYVSSIAYYPNGSPSSIQYGNGVTEALSLNSRLQPCESKVTLPGATQPFLDREYFYGISNTQGTGCNPVTSNNGNIQHILDNVGGDYSQDFSYDSLNRVTQWSAPNMANAYRSQTYNYDSFGNLWQSRGYSTSIPTSSVGTPSARTFPNPLATWNSGDPSPYSANNRLANGFHDCFPDDVTGTLGQVNVYDPAGNLLCGGSNTDLNAKQYIWDAESRIRQVNAQHNGTAYTKAATYTYDADGNRVRSDQFDTSGNTTSWREYSYFNGQITGEKGNTGAWTDYIYASGKRIARVENFQTRVHLHGENLASTGIKSTLSSMPTIQYTIQLGDDLHVRQYSSNALGGFFINFTDNSQISPSDTDGQYSTQDGISGTWHHRIIHLDDSSGCPSSGCKTITSLILVNEVTAPPTGLWDIYYQDFIVVNRNTGQVHALYSGAASQGFDAWTMYDADKVINFYGRSEVSGTDVDGTSPGTKTSYYVSDHLGTAQLELGAAGYPVWKGEFAPFGQELSDPTTTVNRYKFTGKERDTESGLDDFGPRYYASSMGRFISPDDVGGHLEDPQTLNLYSYVANNPLSRTDPSGHDFWQSCDKASTTCGNQVIGKDAKGNDINHLVSGTTDSNGKFNATVITSASLEQSGSGNTAAVNGSGVMITTGTGTSSQQTGQGIFIANTPAADIKGQGAGWNQFSFHIDSNDVLHGALTSGTANYIGTGGHDGMVNAINSMTANGHGPWHYPGEDYYNIFHLGDTNIRFSMGADPVHVNYGPSPHFPVPSSGVSVPHFHVDSRTGPGHVTCAVRGIDCF